MKQEKRKQDERKIGIIFIPIIYWGIDLDDHFNKWICKI